MNGNSPYVVVLASAANRIGCSTLTGNLAVYLKGLAEDLPVAVVSFDPDYDPSQTFALPGHPATCLDDIFSSQCLEEQLTIGQFGVEYLAAGVSPIGDVSQFRRLLRQSNFPGILIIDAGPLENKSAALALQVADLVLTPVRDAAGLSSLAKIRREIRNGGGGDHLLWLMPAMVEDPHEQARQLEVLRFAARERGCQILDMDFVVDRQLPQATYGVGGTVLTRIPDSCVHHLLHHLAQWVLQKFYAGADSGSQLQRLALDGALSPRFHRVEVVCPLCRRPAYVSFSHYCESLPQRRRWLTHADCLAALTADLKLMPFWSPAQSTVIRTGIESGGLLPQLRMVLADDGGQLMESELFQPAANSDWQALIRQATGRTLAEQLPGMIMIYPAVMGHEVMSASWYLSCVSLRKKLRVGLAAEL